MVTSRDSLSGLVAGEGACPLILDLLPGADARNLLAGRIGHDRTVSEAAAVDRIVAACAGLPLALTVVAARAATHPRFGLSAVAEELDASRESLDVFDGADLATDVRAVLSWSYLQLSPEAARLFRLLGLHPGPDIAAPAAASLAGASVAQARRTLAELAGVHLVAEHVPGRFRYHDLLRTYAVELTTLDSVDQRLAAVHRMLDHYLHTAHQAARLLSRHRHPITIDPPRPGAITDPLENHALALAWLTAEHATLLAALRLAEASGLGRHAWQLAWTLTTYLDRRGHWHDWSAAQHTAVRAAGQLGDTAGGAYAHRGLALAEYRIGHYEQALPHLRTALELFASCGDRAGQGYTHLDIAWVLERQGDRPGALDHARRALDLHRRDDHRPGQASALNSVGWFLTRLDDPEALSYCRQAHELYRHLGDRVGQAATLDSLGYAHHRLGDHDRAMDCYQQAVELFRNLGDRYHEAETLTNLGDAHLAAADPALARRHWRHAVAILDELGHPDAGAVRGRLERPGVPAG